MPVSADSAIRPESGMVRCTVLISRFWMLSACWRACCNGSMGPKAPEPKESALERMPTVFRGVIPNWERNRFSSSRGAESDKKTRQSAQPLARRVSFCPSTSTRRVRSSFSTVRVAVPGVSISVSSWRRRLGRN